MGNTAFLFAQTLMAIPLVYEIPFILQFIKPFRFISLFSGIFYNIAYWFGLFDLLYIVFAQNTPPAKISEVTTDEVINPNGYEVVGEDVPIDPPVAEESPVKLFDIMFVLMDLYVLVTHFPITIVNCVIMLKEA